MGNGDKPLLVVVGPTAVGKTECAVRLAQRLSGEVITADSMQVYRGLDIASAKPTVEEMRGVPHHLIDVVDPNEEFNVAEYRNLALRVITDVHGRCRLPIVSGGTGLYIKAILGEFLFPDEGKDAALRRQLEQMADEIGAAALHLRLQDVDPEAAARIHPNDVRRVVRALEVFHTTGVPLSEHLKRKQQPAFQGRLAVVGLTRPRDVIYRRIEDRVDQQIRDGLIDEISTLMDRYGEPKVIAQALGFKEIAAFLRGEVSLDEAVDLLKRNTRRFAKRQYTWFRRDERITWYDLDALGPLDEALSHIEVDVRNKLGC